MWLGRGGWSTTSALHVWGGLCLWLWLGFRQQAGEGCPAQPCSTALHPSCTALYCPAPAVCTAVPQLIQAKLADMYTTAAATRSFVYATARAADAGRASRKDCAAVILYAAEGATRMALDAIQILGGNGCACCARCACCDLLLPLWPPASPRASPSGRWLWGLPAAHCSTSAMLGGAVLNLVPPGTSPLFYCRYINEYPTGRLLRDAKLYEIGAGELG